MKTSNGYRVLVFKHDLVKLNASDALIEAAAGKTFDQFLKTCNKPALLHELLLLKSDSPGWPSTGKIHRLMMQCAFFDVFLFFLKGKKGLSNIKTSILQSAIPTSTHYNHLIHAQ